MIQPTLAERVLMLANDDNPRHHVEYAPLVTPLAELTAAPPPPRVTPAANFHPAAMPPLLPLAGLAGNASTAAGWIPVNTKYEWDGFRGGRITTDMVSVSQQQLAAMGTAASEAISRAFQQRAETMAAFIYSQAGTSTFTGNYSTCAITTNGATSTLRSTIDVPMLTHGYAGISDWGTTCNTTTMTGGGWTDYAITTTTAPLMIQWSNHWGSDYSPIRRSPEERIRDMIRTRVAPNYTGRLDPYARNRPGVQPATDFREVRARDTLLRVVGSEKYKKFLRDGFVTVRGKSGRTYQLFPGSGFTRVTREGKPEKQLCVVLKGNFPPTDSLILRFLMILNDEEGFRALAVEHAAFRSTTTKLVEEPRNLNDVFREMRDAHRSSGSPKKSQPQPARASLVLAATG